jgi:hypothetical protein
MKRFKELMNEDGAVASIPNSVGSPNFKGLEPDIPPVSRTAMLRRRRKKFAGKKVFAVSPDVFYKAKLGKTKGQHYKTLVGEDAVGQQIRDYGRKNSGAPIILENEVTGEMVFLKYGKGRW